MPIHSVECGSPQTWQTRTNPVDPVEIKVARPTFSISEMSRAILLHVGYLLPKQLVFNGLFADFLPQTINYDGFLDRMGSDRLLLPQGRCRAAVTQMSQLTKINVLTTKKSPKWVSTKKLCCFRGPEAQPVLVKRTSLMLPSCYPSTNRIRCRRSLHLSSSAAVLWRSFSQRSSED